ncbi:MAG: hypothetical protein ABR562_06735 [Thermoplasmatota archaeon]|nr:hypothetical protein [Halobacteriales archaeon]
METTSSKPGLFTFAQRPPPTGTGPWEKVANLLRQTGFIILVGGGLSLLTNILLYWQYTTLAYPGASMFGVIWTLAWAAAGLFWVSFTYFHWCNRDVRGWKHAQAIGIVLVVLGGLGAVGGLMAFSAYGLISAFAPVLGTWFLISTLVGLLTSAAYLYFGIQILTNRTKAQAAFPVGTAPPPGMTQ